MFREVLDISRQYAQVPNLYFCKNQFIPNAYAQTFQVPTGPYTPPVTIFRIDYNPNFMGQADVSVNNNFALAGILAHEIGHIEHFAHLGNPYDPNSWQAHYDLNIPWQKELRADEFAGYVLAKMGASVEDVVDTQRTIFSLHVNPQHANSLTRLERMFKGYGKAKNGSVSQDEIDKIVSAQQNILDQYLRWQ